MKLNAPKQITWLIAVIVGVLGIIAHLIAVPLLSVIDFWLVAAALVLLAVATYLPGL